MKGQGAEINSRIAYYIFHVLYPLNIRQIQLQTNNIYLFSLHTYLFTKKKKKTCVRDKVPPNSPVVF